MIEPVSPLYFGNHLAFAFAQPIIGNITREITYGANLTNPNVSPDPATVMRLWFAKRISTRALHRLLKKQGISLAQDSLTGQAWERFMQVSQPRWALDYYRLLWRKGRIDRDYFEGMMDNQGIYSEYDQDIFADDWDHFPVEMVQRLRRKTLMTRERAHQHYRANGLSASDRDAVEGEILPPSVGEILTLLNRDVIQRFQAESMLLTGHGYSNANVERLLELRKVLPSVSELITMMIRDVFTPEVAEPVGLYDEYPEKATPWFRKLGYDWQLDFDIRSDGVRRRASMVDMLWGSHWQKLSASQATEMYQRIRPGRVNRWAPLLGQIPPFLFDDLNRHLRIADIPPGVRKWLTAISYNPLRLFDIRNAIKYRIRDRQWAVEQFLDRGLVNEDAEFAADLAITQRDEFENRDIKAKERQAIRRVWDSNLKAYKLGLFEKDAVRANMIATGLPAATVDRLLSVEDIEWNMEQVKVGITTVRKDFRTGVIDEKEVRRRLTGLQLVPAAIDAYILRWKASFTETTRRASTEKILSWFEKGLLPVQEAGRRLHNLGWSNIDVLLHLADSRVDVLKASARQAQVADAARRKQAAEISKIQQTLAKKQQELQSELRRLTPIAKLQEWYKLGIVSERFFLERSIQMGYDAQTASVYLSEAKTELAKQGVRNGSGTIGGQVAKPEGPEEKTAGTTTGMQVVRPGGTG